MPTPQFVPSIRDSETVTCRRCNTRQYPKNGSCIRCHRTLGVDYVTLQIGAPFDPRTENHPTELARWIGDLLRNLRNRRGICQSQMAKMAAGIDRSYLSKAENGLALLPLNKLLPLAQALGLTAVILRFEGIRPRVVPKSSCRR
jgi:DNA-binding XRE family transcriptional regulator